MLRLNPEISTLGSYKSWNIWEIGMLERNGKFYKDASFWLGVPKKFNAHFGLGKTWMDL